MHQMKRIIYAALGCALGSTGAFAGLHISATFDSNITTNVNSAQIQGTINQAIRFYESRITNNLIVPITFHNMSGGLGASSSDYFNYSYSDVVSALAAHASSALDLTALAHLPTTVNPITGGSTLNVYATNARALGLGVGNYSNDVYINSSICNLDHSVVTDPLKSDMYAVACHEINEILGTPSNNGFDTPVLTDMFRYDGSGNRSYNVDTTQHVYLSADGTNRIVEYNQFGRTNGDWADWIQHPSAPQVQDWRNTRGQIIEMGNSEISNLDLLGYNFQAVPEPSSLVPFGVLGLGLLIRRRRS